MDPVMFRVELEDPAQADAVAQLVEQRLGGLDAIDAVQAEPEELRGLATAVTVVAAAVGFARSRGVGGRKQLVAQARRFIEELEALVDDHPGISRVVIAVGAEEIDLAEVSDEQIAEIAR